MSAVRSFTSNLEKHLLAKNSSTTLVAKLNDTIAMSQKQQQMQLAKLELPHRGK